jgi:hypothetical protein
MLGEQVGAGLVQLKVVLAGTEVRVIFAATPVQIVLGEGVFSTGTGLIMIASDVVVPGTRQFEFVP